MFSWSRYAATQPRAAALSTFDAILGKTLPWHWQSMPKLGKRRRAQLTQKAFQDMGYDLRDRRLLLMMEDLAWALEEYSVKVAQPAYFADFNSGPAKGLPPS